MTDTTYNEYDLRGGRPFVVSCLIEGGDRVLSTRKTFTQTEATHYAHTIAKSRKPKIHRVCIFCNRGWRMDGETYDWPRCEICGAC